MKGPKSLLVRAVVLATATSVAVVGLAAAPASAADLGTLTLTPTQGLTTTNPALSALTSAACPATYGTNAGLKIGKVGSGDYRNLARVGDEANYDQAAFTLTANRSMVSAYGGTALSNGDYEIAVLCTGESTGDNPDLFRTVITVTGENWQVKGAQQPAADTTTSLAVSPASPQVAGTPVTLTATVAPAAATGQVTFNRGATAIGTAPVVNGTATLSVTNLPVGAFALSAAFTPATAEYKASASANVPFTITAPAGTITKEQTITGDIAPGQFSLNVAGTTVSLTGGSVGGQATGNLNKATVVDLRGTNAGWNLVGQVSDFSGATSTIPGSNLGWTPSSIKVSGSGAVVTGANASGLGNPSTLCKAGVGSSAGTFECGAGVTLVIPDNIAPGAYSATLTLTLA